MDSTPADRPAKPGIAKRRSDARKSPGKQSPGKSWPGKQWIERSRAALNARKLRNNPEPARFLKIVSWNLLHLTGASLDDVVRLINREGPDLLLMQEVTHVMDGLTARVGGHYARAPLPGRIHGLAMWSATPIAKPPAVVPLQRGTMFNRVCQTLDLGDFAVANVHLSHGQVLN